jgi:hypothetical protein
MNRPEMPFLRINGRAFSNPDSSMGNICATNSGVGFQQNIDQATGAQSYNTLYFLNNFIKIPGCAIALFLMT